MSRFEKSIQLAQEVYLNKHPEKDEITSGEKTNQIFKEQGGDLFDQSTSKKPGVFSRLAGGVARGAQKLSNAKQQLQSFNQDAENYGTMAAIGARASESPEKQPKEQLPGLFSSGGQQTQQQRQQQASQQTQQQAPQGDMAWQRYGRDVWSKMDQNTKQFFGNDMNKFIQYKKQEATLRQQGIKI